MNPKKVLITGVYGLIGNVLYSHLAQYPEVYEVYGLDRQSQPAGRLPAEQACVIPAEYFTHADLGNLPALQRAVSGMDVVAHLAADPSGAGGWESVLENNLTGAYHTFEACRLGGVKRVVFASSITVNFGYGVEPPYGALLEGRFDEITGEIPLIDHTMPTRPMHAYAASKVWGEALAHAYAYRHGISCLCLRIGWVVPEDRPREPHGRADWCSWRDVAQLFRLCIDAPADLRFDIFYAVSDNRYRFVDLEHARQVLGFVPEDRAE